MLELTAVTITSSLVADVTTQRVVWGKGPFCGRTHQRAFANQLRILDLRLGTGARTEDFREHSRVDALELVALAVLLNDCAF